MKAADGKSRSTDVANSEQLLRIIQSIPSKKAEPFKTSQNAAQLNHVVTQMIEASAAAAGDSTTEETQE